MLKISKQVGDRLISHALEESPNECCGLLLGQAGNDYPEITEIREITKCSKDMGTVFKNCTENFYIRKLLEKVPSIETRVHIKDNIIKGKLDFYNYEKNIDIN